MIQQSNAGEWASKLLWVHALVFGAIALVCYVMPEAPFGDSAWLPLARFAALLFAAALGALTISIVGAALSGNSRQRATALVAALAFDAQVPILSFAQPASLEYLHTGLGIAWFVVPLVFLTLVGSTVHCLLRLKRDAALIHAGAFN